MTVFYDIGLILMLKSVDMYEALFEFYSDEEGRFYPLSVIKQRVHFKLEKPSLRQQ